MQFRLTLLAPVVAAFALSACASQGSVTPPLSPGANAPAISSRARGTVNVRLSVLIPAPPKRHERARIEPHFVSPYTASIESVVNKSTNDIVTITPVTPTSSFCTKQSNGSRICTVIVPAPPGNDTFDFSTWDGSNPAASKELGKASLAQIINPAMNNTLQVYISPIVASFAPTQTFSSLPNIGSPNTYTFTINAYDADGAQIAATDSGTAATSDPYANPIVATLDPTGAQHATLAYNGSAPGSSATVSFSNKQLVLTYDQKAGQGYDATVTLKSAGVSKAATVVVSPLVLQSYSSQFGYSGKYSRYQVSVFGPFNATITATLAGAPAGTTLRFIDSSCATGVANVTVSSSNPPPAIAATVAAGSAGGTCTISFTDGHSTDPVTLLDVDGTMPFPFAPQISGFVYGNSPHEIVNGPDGNLWYSDLQNGTIRSSYPGLGATVRATLNALAGHAISLVTNSPNVWFACTNKSNRTVIGYVNDSTNKVTSFLAPTTFSTPTKLVVGPDGNVWVLGSGKLARVTAAGTITLFALPSTASATMVVQGGHIWLAQWAIGIREYTTSGTVLKTLPLPTAPSLIRDIAVGTDGNFYVTGLDAIVRVTPSGGLNIYAVNGDPNRITVGLDGGLWYDGLQGGIGRFATDGTAQYFSYAGTANALGGITAFPDGNIYAADSQGFILQAYL